MSDDGRSLKVAIEAGLWFRYGGQRRGGVVSDSTFDAVLCGERTSTTRFERWPGHDLWSVVAPGDLVRFFDDKDHAGRSLVVRVDSVKRVNLWTCDAATLEEWSRSEGWAPEKGRALGGELGPALWFRHTLVAPALRPVPTSPQLSLF
jgi:hypothetical protein